MKNSHRQYLVCLIIGLLVCDALAANIKIDTTRRTNKRNNKRVSLNNRDVYTQPKKHLAVLNNKKLLVKMRASNAGGENGECGTWIQPSGGSFTLHETFDVIAQRCAPVDTIIETNATVNTIVTEHRTVGTLGTTGVQVGAMTEVPVTVDTLNNFQSVFQRTKNVNVVVQDLHPKQITIQVRKKVTKTYETIVPVQVTVQSLISKDITVQVETQRKQALHTVYNVNRHMPEVTLRPITIQKVAPKKVNYRVEHSKQVPYYYEENTCRSMLEITQERVNINETTSIGFCDTKSVVFGKGHLRGNNSGAGAEY